MKKHIKGLALCPAHSRFAQIIMTEQTLHITVLRGNRHREVNKLRLTCESTWAL